MATAIIGSSKICPPGADRSVVVGLAPTFLAGRPRLCRGPGGRGHLGALGVVVDTGRKYVGVRPPGASWEQTGAVDLRVRSARRI